MNLLGCAVSSPEELRFHVREGKTVSYPKRDNNFNCYPKRFTTGPNLITDTHDAIKKLNDSCILFVCLFVCLFSFLFLFFIRDSI